LDFNLLEFFNISEQTARLVEEVVIVLGIGLLMGIERQYSKSEDNEINGDELFAGVRTFPIVSLIGYLSVYLGNNLFIWIYPVGFAGVCLFSAIAYYVGRVNRLGGATTEFALIAVFLLGGVVYLQEYLLAVFIAVIITALLGIKTNIHKMIKILSRKEIFSILLFIVITALILPLLPNEGYGRFNVFNPFKIWLIVIIYTSINFLAYFLQKFIDPKYSILSTGIFGGFASSTATTWYFSRVSGKSENGTLVYVAAILFASSIMFPRLIIWLILLNYDLFMLLWLPLLIFGLFGFLFGFYYSKKSISDEKNIKGTKIQNPINLKDSFIFAGFYVLILLVVGYAEEFFDDKGVYVAAALSGLQDVDAITIAMSEYAKQSIQASIAAIAILIAAFSNTLIKYVFCLIFGNNTMRKYSSFAFVPIFLAGIIYIVYLLMY